MVVRLSIALALVALALIVVSAVPWLGAATSGGYCLRAGSLSGEGVRQLSSAWRGCGLGAILRRLDKWLRAGADRLPSRSGLSPRLVTRSAGAQAGNADAQPRPQRCGDHRFDRISQERACGFALKSPASAHPTLRSFVLSAMK